MVDDHSGFHLRGISRCWSGLCTGGPPKGVLKLAIHWGLSADWLYSATCGNPISAHLPLYRLHDSLLNAMPEGTFTPSLAEAYTVSPDSKVYEFKLRRG